MSRKESSGNLVSELDVWVNRIQVGMKLFNEYLFIDAGMAIYFTILVGEGRLRMPSDLFNVLHN